MLQLSCLCTPQLHRTTETSPVHLTPKAMALFVYLAVTQRAHSRDVLADLLWSEMNNRQARANLRYLLPELRRPLAAYLTITTKHISFNRQAPYWLDVEVLWTTLSARPESVSNQTVQAALDLYQAEFLAGFTVRDAPVFEAWVVQQRERLHLLVIQGGYRLAEGYWRQADYANALTITQRLLQWEPWHEAGHRLQMQLLAMTGQRAAALAQYALCQQILAAELGVVPEAATTALYERIRQGEFTVQQTGGQETRRQEDKKIGSIAISLSPVPLSPPLPVSPAVPHNLPRQTTSFVGRDDEVAELYTNLLTTDSRLLTLVGEGGIGKTRLALAVAQGLVAGSGWRVDSQAPPATSHQPQFPDGVWFVSLNDLTAGSDLVDRLATAVAKTIGLSFNGNQPLFTQLLAQLRRKAFCLLFDNAEHLLPAISDLLLQILQQSPRTTILVTSRRILNLQAETVWRVAGLPVPPPVAPATLSLGELARYSSIALFLERANRTQERLPLTPADGPTIAAICRLVEGLPLAIELAAALTKQYTCAALCTALQHDYTILAATSSDHTPHHHSIQAMLDYSWRFLTTEEARLLAACAIFAGGFTRAAVIAVTGAAPALLLSLNDQSLLQMREGRFFMHELVRHYAAAQLAQFPEYRARIAAAHAAYYIALLQEQEAALVIDIAAQQTIQDEIENIRAAWRWSVAQGDLALLTEGLDALYYFYRLTGTYQEAVQLLEAAEGAVRAVIGAATTPQSLALLARLLCHCAEFYRRTDTVAVGKRLAQEALLLGEQIANPALQGWAYHELARLAYTHSQVTLMRNLAEAGCRHARQADAPLLLAECLNDLAIAVGACNGPLAAVPHFQQALAALQPVDNRVLEAFILVNLGFCYLMTCQYQAAYTYLQQGLALQRLLHDQGGRLTPLIHWGTLQMLLGGYPAAQVAFEEALSLIQMVNSSRLECRLYVSYGRWQHVGGDPLAGRMACVHAQQLARQSELALEEQWALIYCGHALTELGEWTAAGDSYQQAIALHKPDNWLYRTAEAQAGLAALRLAQGKVAEALPPTEAALALLAGQGLAAAAEPFTVYWTAVRVFTAAADPRAATVLRTAYQQLQAIAGQLADERWRRAFCEEVVVNRQLIAAARAAGIG